MRESRIERRDVKAEVDAGAMAYKLRARSAPDHIILRPVEVQDKATVGKYVVLREYKAPGKKPRIDQQREHRRLRELGYNVEVIDEL